MLKIYHMFHKSSFFVNIIVIDFSQVSWVQISLMFRTSGFKTVAGFSNVQYIPEQFLQGIW